jgi:hypothetical protein
MKKPRGILLYKRGEIEHALVTMRLDYLARIAASGFILNEASVRMRQAVVRRAASRD